MFHAAASAASWQASGPSASISSCRAKYATSISSLKERIADRNKSKRLPLPYIVSGEVIGETFVITRLFIAFTEFHELSWTDLPRLSRICLTW